MDQVTAKDSILTVTEWRDESGILMPVDVSREESPQEAAHPVVAKPVRREAPAMKVSKGVPKLLKWPYVADTGADTITSGADVTTSGADTITAGTDTIEAGAEMKGIILVNPAGEYVKGVEKEAVAMRGEWGGMSWVYVVLTVMFCVICLKFKGSSRYMKALSSDLTDTRLRNNVFDDTVRETSLLVLMNMMWAINVGVMLWGAVKLYSGMYVEAGLAPMVTNSVSVSCPEWIGIGICTGVSAVYLVVMLTAYWMVGNIFSDSRKTRLWVKGAAASTALETFMLLPVSLLMLIYPGWSEILLWIAAGVFIMGKIVFLYKGFRIFFAEISSWMLFLYYLCSLEIVPLILTYVGAVLACASWHQ